MKLLKTLDDTTVTGLNPRRGEGPLVQSDPAHPSLGGLDQPPPDRTRQQWSMAQQRGSLGPT